MHALHKCLLFNLLTCLGLHVHGSKIINGKKVPANSMTYMAAVQNKDNKTICGGFLISKDYVLTAAHCKNPASVVLGTHNLKKVNEKMRYAVKPCKHKPYVNVQSGNDIMLLQLLPKLQQRLKPIKLPKSEMKVNDKTNCYVAGWGFTKSRGKVVDELQMADVSTVNLEDCKRKWFPRKVELPDNVICAGGYGTDKGFCQGDSGGPLVCGKVAVGIVSFNLRGNCDYPNLPNVYTDISKYLPWINKNLKGKKCEE